MDKVASQASESPEMRELMKRFDERKEVFNPHDENDIHIDLPSPLHNLDIPGVVRKGELTILRCVYRKNFRHAL